MHPSICCRLLLLLIAWSGPFPTNACIRFFTPHGKRVVDGFALLEIKKRTKPLFITWSQDEVKSSQA
jgi:hypothetical protein